MRRRLACRLCSLGGQSPILVQSGSDNLVTTVPEGREVDGELDTPQTLGTKNAATDREGVVAGTGSSARTETMLAIDGGLLENVDFNEPLSQ
jgi:hypothetical protein